MNSAKMGAGAQTKPMPSDKVIQNVAVFPDEHPFWEENEVVLKCMPQIAFNPLFVSPRSKPHEPAISPFWTDPACVDIPLYAIIHDHVAGFVAQNPGRLRHYVTGHFKTIQSPSNRSNFDEIQYIKVPTFWSTIVNPSQLQLALASVSEKEISQDGWSKCLDPAPKLLMQFDFDCSSLLRRFQMGMPVLSL